MNDSETEHPGNKNYAALLIANMAQYEAIIASGQESIWDCRFSHERSKEFSNADALRLTRMEKGWENDPDAVAEVICIISGMPLSRDTIETFCQLWRGGFRTANLSKPT
jgi:hypothetical protein